MTTPTYPDPLTGIVASVDDHATRLGIAPATLRTRMRKRGVNHPATWRRGRQSVIGKTIRRPSGGRPYKSMRDASRSTGVDYSTLKERLKVGMDLERALRPGHAGAMRIPHPVTGEVRTTEEWARLIKVPRATLLQRFARRGYNDPAVFDTFLGRLTPEQSAELDARRQAVIDREEAAREEAAARLTDLAVEAGFAGAVSAAGEEGEPTPLAPAGPDGKTTGGEKKLRKRLARASDGL